MTFTEQADSTIAASRASRAYTSLLEESGSSIELPITTAVEYNGMLATLTLEPVQEDVPL